VGRTKYSATVNSGVVLTLDGDFLEVNTTISAAGRPVAKLSRWVKKWNRETYILTVAAGADVALLTAVCLAFNVARG
jgi:uncharacterized protein YxjI